ncbi:hypothetical protein CBA19CS11_29465 [Caballeronia novacaledonica]|uniref:DUF4255 domain-containing protein n=1 Tax=Caballeronia novacaledonica TaxID=1544861 RepID=UPI001EE2C993|nr:DUF4255 domain-containing protein [Caballeronia novacaledonica]GJH13053.1 hypothetical protein CBA19CS11_29465 [Caballeronia novacaledonica]
MLRLIEEQCPRGEFTTAPQFQLYQSHDFGRVNIGEGFSLMLYRVTINGARNQTPRRGPDGLRRRPALPLDLHFLLTPWAGEAERQMRLLGWAMRFIEDNASIPANELNHSLTLRDRPAFNPDESVELYCDPPGLADYLGLWDKYKNRWQTSVTYLARMVQLESDLPVPDEALVRTRDLRCGVEVSEASS